MKMGRRLLFLFVAAWMTAAVAAAQAYRVEVVELAPPEELGEAVRAELAGQALRVSGPDGALVEIWLRRAVPAKAFAGMELGVIYGQLREGTLVGAARFLTEARDFRRQQVRAGVYTMRYGLLPMDGNHLGVSQHRDFLLLTPAAADTDPAAVPMRDLEQRSSRASGTTHPSVWSLVESTGAAEAPAVSHHDHEDLWAVEFRLTLMPEGADEQKSIPMALVVVGHAAEA